MKFSCGETREARIARRLAELEDKKKWHRVFLWTPVTLDDNGAGKKICLWLCWAERCYPYAYADISFFREEYILGNPSFREITK